MFQGFGIASYFKLKFILTQLLEKIFAGLFLQGLLLTNFSLEIERKSQSHEEDATQFGIFSLLVACTLEG